MLLLLSLRYFWKQCALHSEIKADNLSLHLNLQYSFARLSLVFTFLDKQLLFTSPCTWTADCICMTLIIQTTTACKSPFGKLCPSGRDSFLCMNFWQHSILHNLYCNCSRLLALQVCLRVFIFNCRWLRKKKIPSVIEVIYSIFVRFPSAWFTAFSVWVNLTMVLMRKPSIINPRSWKDHQTVIWMRNEYYDLQLDVTKPSTISSQHITCMK